MLDEITLRRLAKQHLDAFQANVYLLHLYGDARDRLPKQSIKAIGKLLKRRESVVRQAFYDAEEALVKLCHETQAGLTVSRYDHAPESGLYFGDTVAFGPADVMTMDDEVEKTVVLGREIPKQDWTPGMGPHKKC